MASQTAIVGTGANDATNGQTTNWSGPSNVIGDDGSRATASLNASTSRYLKGTNCGFTVPAGATINGITVEIEKSESAAGITDSAVRIVKADGSIGTTDKASATEWALTTDTISTYGSSSDRWGETWSATDINDLDFGVVIAATKSTSGAATARVDFIRVTVNYTAGATVTASAAVAGGGTTDATATRSAVASASAAGSGAVTATALVAGQAGYALLETYDHVLLESGDGLVYEDFASGSVISASAAVIGTGSVAATATRVVSARGSVAGAGAFGATAKRRVIGAGALAGAGAVSATATRSALAQVAISGGGLMAGSAVRITFGVGAFAGQGTITATSAGRQWSYIETPSFVYGATETFSYDHTEDWTYEPVTG